MTLTPGVECFSRQDLYPCKMHKLHGTSSINTIRQLSKGPQTSVFEQTAYRDEERKVICSGNIKVGHDAFRA